MLLPRLFDDDLFDDFFEMERRPMFGKHERMWMKTDVKEKEGSYELEMDLPGFKKEEVQIELDRGYLTITASKNHDVNEDQDNYIRKERYYGSCSRSFYVGENVRHEDIKANFSEGILHLNIPKLDQQKVENKKYIAIE